MKMFRSILIAFAIVSALALTACGGGGGASGGGSGTLDVSVDGEGLAYKPAALTGKAGGPITVNFKNVSSAQQHNWVLVNGGEDVAATVDEDAINAGAPDYLPTTNVVGATKMLQPGGSESITFTAPAAGKYTFICTFPGHYAAGMKGELTIAP